MLYLAKIQHNKLINLKIKKIKYKYLNCELYKNYRINLLIMKIKM